ncbi:MAG: PTS sugar transporter subunit IIA [Elusimicrobia bacterium]|nr:PTS sugar transporter subunit IIA [Elusimicrobiota bacterium]
MKLLSAVLRPEAVLVPLNAATREAAIGALVERLEIPGMAQDRERLKSAVLKREAAGSTGLGRGVAAPHARSSRITAPLLSVGLAPEPIDFRSADGQPVTLVFLVAAPEADPAAHLKILAALSRLTNEKRLLNRLNKAASARELYELLAEVPFDAGP